MKFKVNSKLLIRISIKFGNFSYKGTENGSLLKR